MLSFREAHDLRQGYSPASSPILECIDIIDRDLYRTFPDNDRFQPRPAARRPNAQPRTPQAPHTVGSAAAAAAAAALCSDTPPSPPLSFLDRLDPDPDSTAPSLPPSLVSSSETPVTTPSSSSAPSPARSAHVDDSPPCIATESNPYILALRQVLVAFAYYSWPHPDESRTPSRTCPYAIGYCQSLNFIVAMLLLVFVEADPATRAAFDAGHQPTCFDVASRVFWMLVAIVECLLPPEMYGRTLEGSQIQQDILWTWILSLKGSKFGLERISRWLDQLNCDSPTTPRAYTAAARRGSHACTQSAGQIHLAAASAAASAASSARSRSPAAVPASPVAPSEPPQGSSDLLQLPPPPPLHTHHPSLPRLRLPPRTSSFSMITTPWFMALFVNAMPTETVLRIWDCFFLQGEKILFRVALTLIHMNEDKLVKCTDMADAWRMLKDLPKQVHDADEFIKLCFKPHVVVSPFGSGTSHLSPRLNRFPSASSVGSSSFLDDSTVFDGELKSPTAAFGAHPNSSLPSLVITQHQEHLAPHDPRRRPSHPVLPSQGAALASAGDGSDGSLQMHHAAHIASHDPHRRPSHPVLPTHAPAPLPSTTPVSLAAAWLVSSMPRTPANPGLRERTVSADQPAAFSVFGIPLWRDRPARPTPPVLATPPVLPVIAATPPHSPAQSLAEPPVDSYFALPVRANDGASRADSASTPGVAFILRSEPQALDVPADVPVLSATVSPSVLPHGDAASRDPHAPLPHPQPPPQQNPQQPQYQHHQQLTSPPRSQTAVFSRGIGGVNQKIIEKYRSLVMDHRYRLQALEAGRRGSEPATPVANVIVVNAA
ncbi:hypothetical protein HK105_202742 [Polyrhizophydium stewartii]|uniref:Rab-GAP TBC domain-containing protein n=1 Tax=Polyrhizophydium stewartii TaxID=2732419 RepID=A0ABR4NEH7_9FUNG